MSLYNEILRVGQKKHADAQHWEAYCAMVGFNEDEGVVYLSALCAAGHTAIARFLARRHYDDPVATLHDAWNLAVMNGGDISALAQLAAQGQIELAGE